VLKSPQFPVYPNHPIVYAGSSWKQIGNQSLSGRKLHFVKIVGECPDLIRNHRLLVSVFVPVCPW